MYKPNQILPATFRFFLLGVVLCALWSGDLFAQEDLDSELYQEENTSGQYEMGEAETGMYREEIKKKSTTAKSIEKPADKDVRRKESAISKAGGEKELKKEEMSTLSFNLFLYIVDRFKED